MNMPNRERPVRKLESAMGPGVPGAGGQRHASARGQTLIDVMLSMMLVGVGFSALVSAGVAASRTSSHSYRRYIASELAGRRLEEITFAETKGNRIPNSAGTSAAVQLPAVGGTAAVPPKNLLEPDGVDADLQEYFTAPASTSWIQTTNTLAGMIDAFGRPCTNDKSHTFIEGYSPSCFYRRFIRFGVEDSPNAIAPTVRVQVAVSMDPWRKCATGQDFLGTGLCACDNPKTTPFCTFSSKVFTR